MYELLFVEEDAADLAGAELLAYLDDRLPRLLVSARKLHQSGCQVSLTLTGFQFELHPDETTDPDAELARLVPRCDILGEINDVPIRTIREVGETLNELFDRVWYERKLVYLDEPAPGHPTSVEVIAGMLKAMREVEERYGRDNLIVPDAFSWGMINGKFSALRWVSGFEWDFLKTRPAFPFPSSLSSGRLCVQLGIHAATTRP